MFNRSSEKLASAEEDFGTINLRELTESDEPIQGLFNGEIEQSELYLAIDTRTPPPHTIRIKLSNISKLSHSVKTQDTDSKRTCPFCKHIADPAVVEMSGRYSINTHSHCLQAVVKRIDEFIDENSHILLSYNI